MYFRSGVLSDSRPYTPPGEWDKTGPRLAQASAEQYRGLCGNARPRYRGCVEDRCPVYPETIAGSAPARAPVAAESPATVAIKAMDESAFSPRCLTSGKPAIRPELGYGVRWSLIYNGG